MQRGAAQRQEQQQQQQHESSLPHLHPDFNSTGTMPQRHQQAEAEVMRSARTHTSLILRHQQSQSNRSGEPLILPPLRSLDRSGAHSQRPRSSTFRTPNISNLGHPRGPSAFHPGHSPPLPTHSSLSSHARSDSEGVTSLSHYIIAPPRSVSVTESNRAPVSPTNSYHSYEDEPHRTVVSGSYHREHAASMAQASSSLATMHLPSHSPNRTHTSSSVQFDRSDAAFSFRQPNARVSVNQPLDKDTEHKLIFFYDLCTDVTVLVGSLLDARHEPQPEQLRDMLSRINEAGELLSTLSTPRQAVPSPWSAHQALPIHDNAAWQDAKRRRVEPTYSSRSLPSQGAAVRLGSPPLRNAHALPALSAERSWNLDSDVTVGEQQYWRRQAPSTDDGDDYRSSRQHDGDIGPQGENSLDITAYARTDRSTPNAEDCMRRNASANVSGSYAASYPSSSTDGETTTSIKYRKRSRAPAPTQCASCGISETPEWRRGPDGARTVCNACGLHFAKLAKRRAEDQSSAVTLEELRISIGLPEGSASGIVMPSHAQSAAAAAVGARAAPNATRTNVPTPAAAYVSARAHSEALYQEALHPGSSKRRALSQGSSNGAEDA